jgi:N-acetylmuramoyl-L-alanine amidase
VVQLDDFVLFKYDALASPPRLYFDLFSAKLTGDLAKGVSIEVPEDPVVTAIRFGQNRESKARLVLDLSEDAVFDVAWLSNPPRMVLEIRPKAGVPAPASRGAEQVAAAVPPVKERSFEDALADAKRLQETAAREKPVSTGFLPTAQAASLPPNVPVRPAAQPFDPAVGSTDPAPTMAKVSPPSEAALRPRDPAPANLATPKAADSPSAGSQGLIRALGLKIGRVVIDAGHGGHDTGMIGPSGLLEKDVVLDIALELGRLVEQKLGAEVVYTRSDDRYLKPAARTKVANEAKADLFISVHANASSVRSVRGIETYYLNLTTDAWAMKVASRENADSDRSVHELRDLLGKIAQQDRVAESREFATRMQAAVFSGLTKGTSGLRNRGVRQAPLIVLIGAQMPAILAEVGFLSNPTDEKLFEDKAYRRQVAQHLYDGVAAYMATLSNNQLTMTDEPRASAAHDND